MSVLPEGWAESCRDAEDQLKNFTPINPISPKYCIDSACPAAICGEFYTPAGKTLVISCMFSRCLKRYPKSLKRMK